jgi:hypothetical protein
MCHSREFRIINILKHTIAAAVETTTPRITFLPLLHGTATPICFSYFFMAIAIIAI